MKTPIRSFNSKGIQAFYNFLTDARDGDISPLREDILTSGYLTEIVIPSVEIEAKEFLTKEEMTIYLYDKITNVGDIPFKNRGMWTWLAAFYFESICPVRKDKRKIQEDAKYILNTEHWGRYYRHLLAIPVRLYYELGSLSMIYLAGTPDKHGDIIEQLASRQEIAANPGLIEAVTSLYWDNEKQKIKRGARNKSGRGVLRRFATNIVPQFQMTYDLNSMSGDEILSLLPSEFNDWKS